MNRIKMEKSISMSCSESRSKRRTISRNGMLGFRSISKVFRISKGSIIEMPDFKEKRSDSLLEKRKWVMKTIM